MTEAHTCEASQERKWPGLSALLFGPPLPRCGKPATLCRGGLWLCQDCHDHIDQLAKSGKNLLSILSQVQQEADAEARKKAH